MPPAYEEAVQNAFTTLLNKLFYGEQTLRLLSDYASAVRREETEEVEAERRSIAARLADVERKREALLCRMLAEPTGVELRQQKLALEARARALQERRALLVTHATQAEEAAKLRNALEARGILRDYCAGDGRLFAIFVRRAVVWSRERVEFQLTCGLVLSEAVTFAS